ncbi:hypothetical protein UNH65_18365 [Chitinophaga sp. 180180018-2]|nr:hypothetical protein [Chitinophaga sp. 212800010-3]
MTGNGANISRFFTAKSVHSDLNKSVFVYFVVFNIYK